MHQAGGESSFGRVNLNSSSDSPKEVSGEKKKTKSQRKIKKMGKRKIASMRKRRRRKQRRTRLPKRTTRRKQRKGRLTIRLMMFLTRLKEAMTTIKMMQRKVEMLKKRFLRRDRQHDLKRHRGPKAKHQAKAKEEEVRRSMMMMEAVQMNAKLKLPSTAFLLKMLQHWPRVSCRHAARTVFIDLV